MGIFLNIIKSLSKIDKEQQEKRKKNKLAFEQAKMQELGRLKAQEIDSHRFKFKHTTPFSYEDNMAFVNGITWGANKTKW